MAIRRWLSPRSPLQSRSSAASPSRVLSNLSPLSDDEQRCRSPSLASPWFPYKRTYGAGKEFFEDTYKLPTLNKVGDFSECAK
jgi:hypothetical protein